MRILIVEDDDRIAKPLAEDLRQQHHVVEIAEDGIQGWEYTQAIDYDLILLDIMLPKLDGISLCQQLRQSNYKALILMLTAKDTTSDKILGLDAGADDYLVKPFELAELAARIRALSRRSSEIRPSILKYGKLQLNPVSSEVTYNGKAVILTSKEYLILELLMQHRDRVFSHSEIFDKLWELDKVINVGDHTVRTHITNLRHKLKTAGISRECIETVYGFGYRLRPEK
ncbi:response regulator transcription factor [Gloeocapsa sp. PCC 73106]|uniref:response regulator transcription factor n=1 Tax=Gloeocapsa sp. PCC 73106 TaxID=102232 RepID=UPI0002ACC0F0|nr:response regulator transcription factor [Gloeocapsa sp. PCC 73106]ELR96510.1 response regulator with CheY-like receiver domain and winged-helix DNA-binding domain [Gloeocapsa sp. PCC 73106]